MIFTDKELEESFNNILDTFTGADGGVRFIKFRMLLQRMEAENSESSRQILLILKRFSKLIEVSNT